MPWQTGQIIVALSSLDGTVAFTGFSLSSQPLGLAVVIDALIGDTAGLPYTPIVVALSSPNAVLAVFENSAEPAPHGVVRLDGIHECSAAFRSRRAPQWSRPDPSRVGPLHQQLVDRGRRLGPRVAVGAPPRPGRSHHHGGEERL